MRGTAQWGQVNVQLWLIEPGKPNQSAYDEPFNGHLRNECVNEYPFTSPLHALIIETWRREYDEERPKRRSAG